MATRRTERKRKRIVIAALIAIAIAETGYILYAFGLLGGGGGGFKLGLLGHLLRVICGYTLGNEEQCYREAVATLVAPRSLIVIRYVDLSKGFNKTKLVQEIVDILKHSDSVLVDVYLTPYIEVPAEIQREVRRALGLSAQEYLPYVVYPISEDYSVRYYLLLLDTLVLLMSEKSVKIEKHNVTELIPVNITRTSNVTTILLRPQATTSVMSLALLNMTFRLTTPVTGSSIREIHARLREIVQDIMTSATFRYCKQIGNKTACREAEVLAGVYEPVNLTELKVDMLRLYMLVRISYVNATSTYLNATLSSKHILVSVSGLTLPDTEVHLVVVGDRLSRRIVYAVVGPVSTEAMIRLFENLTLTKT